MAKSKNSKMAGLSSLPKASKGSGLLGAGELFDSVNATSSPGLKPSSSGEVRGTSLGGTRLASGISFGRPSKSSVSVSGGGSEWSKLLQETASEGIAAALQGTFSVGGINQIISGVAGLFGNKKATEAPLVQFQLPASQNQTLSIHAASLTAQQFQDQSTQIAQAVKTALLHSSSLNDVISEI